MTHANERLSFADVAMRASPVSFLVANRAGKNRLWACAELVYGVFAQEYEESEYIQGKRSIRQWRVGDGLG